MLKKWLVYGVSALVLGCGALTVQAENAADYRAAAETGDAEAQFNLGLCYHYGRGVAKNLTEAVKWYRKAAEQGHVKAQANLGECYYFGQGVKQDFKEAAYWYRKAAVLDGETSGPYAELKKKYGLDNRHIEFLKQQPAPAFLITTRPKENTRLMMLVRLDTYYSAGYKGSESDNYSIRVRVPRENRGWGWGYIARDSVDGKKLLSKLKDGDWHFAEIEIHHGKNSYDYMTRRWWGEHFDIVKVIDVR